MKQVENGVGAGKYFIEVAVDGKRAVSPVQVIEFNTPDDVLNSLSRLEPSDGQPVLALRQGPLGMCAVKVGPDVMVTEATWTFFPLGSERTTTLPADVNNGITRFSTGYVQLSGEMPGDEPFSAKVYFQPSGQS